MLDLKLENLGNCIFFIRTIYTILITNFLQSFREQSNLQLYFQNNKILFVRMYKEQTFRETRIPMI